MRFQALGSQGASLGRCLLPRRKSPEAGNRAAGDQAAAGSVWTFCGRRFQRLRQEARGRRAGLTGGLSSLENTRKPRKWRKFPFKALDGSAKAGKDAKG